MYWGSHLLWEAFFTPSMEFLSQCHARADEAEDGLQLLHQRHQAATAELGIPDEWPPRRVGGTRHGRRLTATRARWPRE